MTIWSCAYCGTKNDDEDPFVLYKYDENDIERCRNCQIARYLAEFKEKLTEQETLALAWATKFEPLDAERVRIIAKNMRITREELVDLLVGVHKKLKGTERVNEIIALGAALELLAEYNVFEQGGRDVS